MEKLSKIIYSFLKDKVSKPFILRYPYQYSPVDIKAGYVSWNYINATAISTQGTFIKDGNVYYNQLWDNVIMMIIESPTKNGDALQQAESIFMLLNSIDFIKYGINNDTQLYSIKSSNAITNDTYFHEIKDWFTKCTFEIGFICNMSVLANSTANPVKIKVSYFSL